MGGAPVGRGGASCRGMSRRSSTAWGILHQIASPALDGGLGGLVGPRGGAQGGLWEDFGTDGSKSVFVPLVYWLLFFFLGPSWAPPAGPSSWWAPPRRCRGRLMLLGRRIGVLLDGLGALVGASSSWAVKVSDEGFATKRRRMRRLRVYNSLHNIGNDPG